MLVGLLMLQAATAVGSGVDGPVLWREFRQGMSPEAFAESLGSVDGVKKVEVVRKRNKAPTVKIAYVDEKGLPIGALTVAVQPSFEGDKLSAITLVDASCYSAALAKSKATLDALAEKYPKNQRVSVVDPDGVALGVKQSFYNEETRVTVSLTPIDNPYPQHVYGGSGFMAAMNKLANSMADSKYNDAIAACPDDRGKKALVQVEYVSQSDFVAEHAVEEAARDAKNRATKEGL